MIGQLWEEFTGVWWISLTKSQSMDSVSMALRNHVIWVMEAPPFADADDLNTLIYNYK